MRRFRYPYGAMLNFKRKPVSFGFHKFKHRNKYNAHKIKADGNTFDSKTEYEYYELLKLSGKRFKCHPRFEILPHTKWNQKHNYTADFAIYDDKGNLIEVDDVKGISLVPAYDHLRMDMWQRLHHMPITIVRKKNGRFVKKQRRTFRS